MTQEQLHEIGLRRSAGDVIALLWEIKRLRALVLRADQLQRTCGGQSCSTVVLNALRTELEGEPCIEEQLRITPKS